MEIETDTPPRVLKHRVLLHLEEQLGRKRSKDKYAPRTVDLDLALDDDLNLKREGLTLPDLASVQRPFLAIPLRERTPDWGPIAFYPWAKRGWSFRRADAGPLTQLLRQGIRYASKHGEDREPGIHA